MNLAWTTNPVWLIINTLAAYRLTRLWVSDMLPPLPRVRAFLRTKAQQRWDAWAHPVRATQAEWQARDRKQAAYNDTPPLSNLVDCYWCAGFWISLATALAASITPTWLWALPATALAMSALVGILGRSD